MSNTPTFAYVSDEHDSIIVGAKQASPVKYTLEEARFFVDQVRDAIRQQRRIIAHARLREITSQLDHIIACARDRDLRDNEMDQVRELMNEARQLGHDLAVAQ